MKFGATQLATQIAMGIVFVDFSAAFFHWMEDTYLHWTDSPGVMGDIARANEMHHYIPYSITTSSVFDNMKVTTLMSLVFAAGAYMVAPKWTVKHSLFIVTVVVLGSLVNVIHRYEHERECKRPPFITMLQRAGILVSQEQHTAHHKYPDEKYGVFLGFTNHIYDTLGVWRFLEAVLPFTPHTPPSVLETKHNYDAWLRDNMDKPCPDRITPEMLEQYMDDLREYSVESTR